MTKLKPCPFCNTDLSVMNGRIWHPSYGKSSFGNCILGAFSFTDSEMNRQMWNKRVKK